MLFYPKSRREHDSDQAILHFPRHKYLISQPRTPGANNLARSTRRKQTRHLLDCPRCSGHCYDRFHEMPCAATQHVCSVAHVNIRVSSKDELVRSQILRPRLSNFIERHIRGATLGAMSADAACVHAAILCFAIESKSI